MTDETGNQVTAKKLHRLDKLFQTLSRFPGKLIIHQRIAKHTHTADYGAASLERFAALACQLFQITAPIVVKRLMENDANP